MSDEHGEPAQHDALQLRKEPVTPVQRCMQGFLTRRRGARTQPQQGQALIEKRRSLLQSVSPDPSSGELNRKRHAVELVGRYRRRLRLPRR